MFGCRPAYGRSLLSCCAHGSSQLALDIAARSGPGWLSVQGQPRCEDILTLLFREPELLHGRLGLLLAHQPFSKHPSLAPARRRHGARTSGLALHACAWPNATYSPQSPEPGAQLAHTFFFFLPFEGVPSLNPVPGHGSQRDTLHWVYL